MVRLFQKIKFDVKQKRLIGQSEIIESEEKCSLQKCWLFNWNIYVKIFSGFYVAYEGLFLTAETSCQCSEIKDDPQEEDNEVAVEDLGEDYGQPLKKNYWQRFILAKRQTA